MDFRKPSDWAGLALCLWFTFWPTPYLLAFFACAFAPLLATAFAAGRRDVALTKGTDFEVDISLWLFWILPSGTLTLRALRDANTLDWAPALIAGIGVGGIASVLMWRVDTRGDRRLSALLLVVVVMLAWGWGLVSLLNARLDRSAGELAISKVTDKVPAGSKSPAQLILQIEDPMHRRLEMVAPRRLFDRAQVGSTVRLKIRPGLFGWRHVDFDRSDRP